MAVGGSICGLRMVVDGCMWLRRVVDERLSLAVLMVWRAQFLCADFRWVSLHKHCNPLASRGHRLWPRIVRKSLHP